MRSLNLVRLVVAPLTFVFILFSNIALAGNHCAKSKDAVACGKAKGCMWSGTACTSKKAAKAAAKKAPAKAGAAAKKEVEPAAPAAEEETGGEMEESEEL